MIARWIDAGAAADAGRTSSAATCALPHALHWAFRPPVKPRCRRSTASTGIHTAVDAFILARLEAKGLALSRGSRETEVDSPRERSTSRGCRPRRRRSRRFSPNERRRVERLIDRLLASPAYGERWGRHWLDNAGYSDTHGGDNDLGRIKENKDIWKYRDYVVRSLNADKPFDQFITEQLAGDEEVEWRNVAGYKPETLDALVATGFLRLVPDDTNEAELNRPLERNEIVGRVTESVASNLLGLTFQCARCHNHKYDPVTQEDYYRLVACFTPVYDPGRWKLPAERCLPDVPPTQSRPSPATMRRSIAQIEEAGKPAVGAAGGRRACAVDPLRRGCRNGCGLTCGGRLPTPEGEA